MWCGVGCLQVTRLFSRGTMCIIGSPDIQAFVVRRTDVFLHTCTCTSSRRVYEDVAAAISWRLGAQTSFDSMAAAAEYEAPWPCLVTETRPTLRQTSTGAHTKRDMGGSSRESAHPVNRRDITLLTASEPILFFELKDPRHLLTHPIEVCVLQYGDYRVILARFSCSTCSFWFLAIHTEAYLYHTKAVYIDALLQ